MRKKIFGLVIMASFNGAFAADQVAVSTGFDYSSGTYGNAQATEILYLPVTAKYAVDDWMLKLTVPYIRVSGPGGVVQGFGRIVPSTSGYGGGSFGRTSSGTTANTQAGMGDIVASAGHALYTGEADELDLFGTVKLGTADSSKGLGTGKNDYSAEADEAHSLGDTSSLLATAGYKIIGAPTGVTVNNVAFGSIGLDQKAGESMNAGILLDYMQKITAYGYAQEDATLYVAEKLSSTFSLQGHLLKGFSYGSPKYAVGGTLTGYF